MPRHPQRWSSPISMSHLAKKMNRASAHEGTWAVGIWRNEKRGEFPWSDESNDLTLSQKWGLFQNLATLFQFLSIPNLPESKWLHFRIWCASDQRCLERLGRCRRAPQRVRKNFASIANEDLCRHLEEGWQLEDRRIASRVLKHGFLYLFHPDSLSISSKRTTISLAKHFWGVQWLLILSDSSVCASGIFVQACLPKQTSSLQELAFWVHHMSSSEASSQPSVRSQAAGEREEIQGEVGPFLSHQNALGGHSEHGCIEDWALDSYKKTARALFKSSNAKYLYKRTSRRQLPLCWCQALGVNKCKLTRASWGMCKWPRSNPPPQAMALYTKKHTVKEAQQWRIQTAEPLWALSKWSKTIKLSHKSHKRHEIIFLSDMKTQPGEWSSCKQMVCKAWGIHIDVVRDISLVRVDRKHNLLKTGPWKPLLPPEIPQAKVN